MRFALFLLIASVLIPALLFGGLEYRNAVQERGDEIANNARDLARAVAFDVERELSIRASLLQTLAASPWLTSGDLQTLYAQARAVVSGQEDWIVLVDFAGKQHFNTRFPYGANLPGVGDLETLREVATSGDLKLSDLFGGVARDVPLGRPLVSLSIPLSQQRVLTWRFQSAFFNEFLRLQMPAGWTAALLDRSGRLIARTVRADMFVGKQPNPEFWKMAAAEARGFRATISLDNVESLTAWHRLASGWTAVVFIPRAAALAGTRGYDRLISSIILFGALAICLSAALAAWINRQFRGVAHAAIAIASGLPAARPAPTLREARDVAHALDLAAQDAEQRRHAEAALRNHERRLSAILDALPIGVALVDRDGHPLLGNAVYSDYVPGNSPSDDDASHQFWEGHDGDGRRTERSQYPTARALRGERVWPGQDFLFTREPDDPRWTRVAALPFRDEQGEVIGATTVVIDIDREKRALNALRASEEQLRLALDSGGMGAWIWRLDGSASTVDDNTLALFGTARPDWAGDAESLLARLVPEDRAMIEQAARRSIDHRLPYDVEFRVRLPHGALRWLAGHGRVEYDGGGRPLLMRGVNYDISERKRAEEHQRLLINELNHRVKNTLAVVQSIAMQTFRRKDFGPDATDAFQARLCALSSAHDILTREHWEGADLRDIVAQAVAPHDADGSSQFAIDGPSVRLTPKVALALAMGLHELCTNAAKYGALSQASGRVSIRWTLGGATGGGLSLRWEEIGGPPVEKPQRRGFGTRLVEELLAGELDATIALHYPRSGVVCTVDVDLAPARNDGAIQ